MNRVLSPGASRVTPSCERPPAASPWRLLARDPRVRLGQGEVGVPQRRRVGPARRDLRPLPRQGPARRRRGQDPTRTWDDDKGARHWKTEIVASSVEMLSRAPAQGLRGRDRGRGARGPGRRRRATRPTRPSRRGRGRLHRRARRGRRRGRRGGRAPRGGRRGLTSERSSPATARLPPPAPSPLRRACRRRGVRLAIRDIRMTRFILASRRVRGAADRGSPGAARAGRPTSSTASLKNHAREALGPRPYSLLTEAAVEAWRCRRTGCSGSRRRTTTRRWSRSTSSPWRSAGGHSSAPISRGRAPGGAAGLRGDLACGIGPGRAGRHEGVHAGARVGTRRLARLATSPPLDQPTTITNSPRAGIEPSPACPASEPSGPRTTCSWSLVSSRHTAPGRSAPQAAARSRSVAATRFGASNTTLPRSSAAIAGQPLASLAAGARQEPLERPARPRDAGRGDRRQHRRGAGDRHHHAAGRGPGRDEALPRVGHDGRAGVGDEGEVPARREVVQQLALARGAAPRVVADRAGRDLVALEQAPADARVLGGDQRHGAQDLEGAVRDVAEVADRGGDDVQRPAGRRRPRGLVRHRQGRAEPGRRRGYR